MAKLKGPLLSDEAHGSIASALTYSKRHGFHYTRKFNKPLAPPSAKQRGQRRLTEFIVAQWQNMDGSEKATWNAIAKLSGLNLPGYQYFLREAQRDLYTYTGLCGYWHFNEVVDGKVLDLSGNDNHGTLKPNWPKNSPQLVKSRTPRFGNALDFDGQVDRVNCGKESSLDIGTEVTFEAWFKTNIFVNWKSIFSKSPLFAESKGYEFFLGEKLVGARIGDSGYIEPGYPYSMNTGQWYCFTFTWDGNWFDWYLNGVWWTRNPRSPTPAATTENLLIGEANSGAGIAHFDGSLDEICIYNRALSPAEITTRYEFAKN